MTPTAAAGLSTADIEEIRRTLAAGRKPKVVFTAQAGQIAGEVGQVVQLADPQHTDEWLVVRFGRDELPFSPADLAIPSRGRAARKQAGRQADKPAGKPPGKQPGRRSTDPPSSPAGSQPANPTNPANPANSAKPPAAGAAAPPAGEPTHLRRPAKRVAKTARATRPKPPAAMTVTLAYEAGEWTVAAHQGSKALAKPYLIRPAEALKMVAMLDVPGVHEAVEQIVNAELAEAQRRADTLRSELAEVESRLAELRDAG
jgi:hypothetical protein